MKNPHLFYILDSIFCILYSEFCHFAITDYRLPIISISHKKSLVYNFPTKLFGSKQSRRPSERRLKHITVIKIAKPGARIQG